MGQHAGRCDCARSKYLVPCDSRSMAHYRGALWAAATHYGAQTANQETEARHSSRQLAPVVFAPATESAQHSSGTVLGAERPLGRSENRQAHTGQQLADPPSVFLDCGRKQPASVQRRKRARLSATELQGSAPSHGGNPGRAAPTERAQKQEGHRFTVWVCCTNRARERKAARFMARCKL